MGKAALILVLGTSLFLAYGAVNRNETGLRTAQEQASYEERVIAREIARTGFNVAMGILREHGDDLTAGVNAINGNAGYFEGESQGGFYRAHARFRTGYAVEVISHGYFGGAFDGDSYVGGAHYAIEDNFLYEVARAPLHVAECSRLHMNFLQSMAGWCSAVYMERYLPGQETQPVPEMIFAPGRNRNSGSITVEKILEGGTQMNFFIAVRQDCRPVYGDFTPTGTSALWHTYDVENHVYSRNNYNHVHYALDLQAGKLNEMQESIWAMVEQHPENNQRWRIAWEDQHNWNLAPNHQHYLDPTRSLGGLKIMGYDGDGWTVRDTWGYRTLRDYGNRPDFSDQVVELWMEPASCSGGVAAGGGEEGGGGVPSEPPPSEPPPSTPPPSEPPPSTPPPTFDSPDTPINQITSNHRFDNGVGCPCHRNNNNRKILVWHQQGGSAGNALCIAQQGWDGSGNGNSGHKSHERDYIMCRGD